MNTRKRNQDTDLINRKGKLDSPLYFLLNIYHSKIRWQLESSKQNRLPTRESLSKHTLLFLKAILYFGTNAQKAISSAHKLVF